MTPTHTAGTTTQIVGRNATVQFEGPTITKVTSGDASSRVFIAPGFVDLQVNGVDAVDFGIAKDARTIAHALTQMAEHGTTACLPTIVTAELDQYDDTLDRIREAQALSDAQQRSQILGVHLEGPFLGGATGAHPRHLIRPVDIRWLTALIERHSDLIRLVTLAPEADPGFEGIALLKEHNILVALGHSNCSYETAVSAIDAGATIATHLFNGMSGLHHRDPGLATAALLDDRITPTLIADLHHVSAPAIGVALATKQRIALITDSVAPGAGESGSMKIEQRGGAVFLEDGTLAGSVIHMIDAVRILVGLGISIERAVTMAATVPCDLLGRNDLGRLTPGAAANLVELHFESAALQRVWLHGAPI